MSRILEEARRALEIEIEGVQGLMARLGDGRKDGLAAPFEQAVQMLHACTGKVVVTGIGKSGHIANKIAATFASTGTMAFFLHPAEAIHGDLGQVGRDDVVLAISNSGNTEELVRLLGPLRRIGAALIAMTGNPGSELARRAEVHLDVSVAREACPLNLAPTASTTAALALGDALAMCLLSLRNFRPEDYAVFHPGGNLGKKLLTTVADLMEGGEKLPAVPQTATVQETIAEIQKKHYGMTCVVDGAGRLTGAFSMGDFTRLAIRDQRLGFMARPVADFMTRDPKTIPPDALAARALNVMETHTIRSLIAIDADRRPVGIIGIYEVLKAIDY
ncbi:MAG: KpsF/GutQ family sugar-phosphate isomerase [Candidatus Lambdaproteobacteria bacterium]|nr:KpsF/GutQ family sugar-phosphate isomerase [Candidatus Lambdaproteobacteria bacterium]